MVSAVSWSTPLPIAIFRWCRPWCCSLPFPLCWSTYSSTCSMPGSIPESAIARGKREMALATPQPYTIATAHASASQRSWAALCKFVRTKPLGAAGAAVILVMVFAAFFADVIAPYDAYELNQRLQFRAPTLAHWLGTDEFGRDVLTRLIYGARIALFIGFASSFIGATAGAMLGVISAYLGGKTDLWLQRLMDILLAFPLLVLALAIVAVLGRSIPNLVVAIAMPMIPRTARIVRA